MERNLQILQNQLEILARRKAEVILQADDCKARLAARRLAGVLADPALETSPHANRNRSQHPLPAAARPAFIAGLLISSVIGLLLIFWR